MSEEEKVRVVTDENGHGSSAKASVVVNKSIDKSDEGDALTNVKYRSDNREERERVREESTVRADGEKTKLSESPSKEEGDAEIPVSTPKGAVKGNNPSDNAKERTTQKAKAISSLSDESSPKVNVIGNKQGDKPSDKPTQEKSPIPVFGENKKSGSSGSFSGGKENFEKKKSSTDTAKRIVSAGDHIAHKAVRVGKETINKVVVVSRNAANGSNDFGGKESFGNGTSEEAQKNSKATVQATLRQGGNSSKAVVHGVERAAREIEKATVKTAKKAAKSAEKTTERTAKTVAKVTEQAVVKTAETTAAVAAKVAETAAETSAGPVGLYISLGLGIVKIIIVGILILIIATITLINMATYDEEQKQWNYASIDLDDNALKIFEYLIDEMEYDEIHAVGVLANIYCESGYYPGAINPSSGAYGICQWMGGRYDALCAYAEANGKEPSDLQMQIEYMAIELAGPGWTRWDGTYDTLQEFLDCTTIDDAAFWMVYGFERPALWDECVESVGPYRASIAYSIYEKIRLYQSGQGGEVVVNAALKELGNEGGEKYWSWYGFSKREEWCAIFASYIGKKTGLVDQGLAPINSFAGLHAQWFEEQGRLVSARDIEPQPGYFIYFDWEAGTRNPDGIIDHVGIVVGVESGKVLTVEGNNGDAVSRAEYPLDAEYVVSYGIPDFSSFQIARTSTKTDPTIEESK